MIWGFGFYWSNEWVSDLFISLSIYFLESMRPCLLSFRGSGRMYARVEVCHFCCSSKTLCNISSFPISAKRKQRLMRFPKIMNIWRTFTGLHRRYGEVLLWVFLLCTSPHRQTMVAGWDRTGGGAGGERKAISGIKRTVSFPKEHVECQLKRPLCLFSLSPVALIFFSSSCCLLFFWFSHFFFLPLPPN